METTLFNYAHNTPQLPPHTVVVFIAFAHDSKSRGEHKGLVPGDDTVRAEALWPATIMYMGRRVFCYPHVLLHFVTTCTNWGCLVTSTRGHPHTSLEAQPLPPSPPAAKCLSVCIAYHNIYAPLVPVCTQNHAPFAAALYYFEPSHVQRARQRGRKRPSTYTPWLSWPYPMFTATHPSIMHTMRPLEAETPKDLM